MQGESSGKTGQSLSEEDRKQIGKDQPKADHIAEEYTRIATHCKDKNIGMGWFDFIQIPPPQKDDQHVDPTVWAQNQIKWSAPQLTEKMSLGEMFSLCFKMLDIAPKVGRSATPDKVKTVYRREARLMHVDKVKNLHPGVVWLDQETSMEDAAAACMRVLDISAQVTEHFLKLSLVSKLIYDSEFRLLSSHSL